MYSVAGEPMSDGKASGARLQRVIVRGARAGVREMGAIPMKLSDCLCGTGGEVA